MLIISAVICFICLCHAYALPHCKVIELPEGLIQRNIVNVIYTMESSCKYCARKASMLPDFKTALQNSGIKAHFIVGLNKRSHRLSNLSSHLSIDKRHLWKALGEQNNHFYIIDRCGRMVYEIINPWSSLQMPFLRGAIIATQFSHPCGLCPQDYLKVVEEENIKIYPPMVEETQSQTKDTPLGIVMRQRHKHHGDPNIYDFIVMSANGMRGHHRHLHREMNNKKNHKSIFPLNIPEENNQADKESSISDDALSENDSSALEKQLRLEHNSSTTIPNSINNLASNSQLMASETQLPLGYSDTKDNVLVKNVPSDTQDQILFNNMLSDTQDQILVNNTSNTKNEILVNNMPSDTKDQILVNNTPSDAKDQILVNNVPGDTKDQILVNNTPSNMKDNVLINNRPSDTKDQIVVNNTPSDIKDQILDNNTPSDMKDNVLINNVPSDIKDNVLGNNRLTNNKDNVFVNNLHSATKENVLDVNVPSDIKDIVPSNAKEQNNSVNNVPNDTNPNANFRELNNNTEIFQEIVSSSKETTQEADKSYTDVSPETDYNDEEISGDGDYEDSEKSQSEDENSQLDSSELAEIKNLKDHYKRILDWVKYDY